MHCSHVHKVLKSSTKGFVCEEIKEQVQTKKIKFLDYVIQSEQIKKNSENNAVTGLCQNESRKYKPF
jgi:hypothetical protein